MVKLNLIWPELHKVTQDTAKMLNKSIKCCQNNGKRILEDSELLYDFGKYSSAYGLAKLAQEEFSKAFILKLVDLGALNWDKQVQKSLNHHVSKQMVSIILNFINPTTEVFLEKIKNKTFIDRPEEVCDAINIYVHEILRRWESSTWSWAEVPKYNKRAKSVFDRKEEKMKHNAFYIKILDTGFAVDSTNKFTKKVAKKEIENAERYCHAVDMNSDYNYCQLVETFKVMKKFHNGKN